MLRNLDYHLVVDAERKESKAGERNTILEISLNNRILILIIARLESAKLVNIDTFVCKKQNLF